MQKQETVTDDKEDILLKHPSMVGDPTQLKYILTPLELYILKLFIEEGNPLIIRDVYKKTMLLIFNEIVVIRGRTAPHLTCLLKKEGYGTIGREINESELGDLSLPKGLTQQGEIDYILKVFRKYKVKHPSYELLQSIVVTFEHYGVLNRRMRDKTAIFFSFTPTFIKTMQQSFKAITQL